MHIDSELHKLAVDPETQKLAAQLAETAVRNTATSVADKISVLHARKKDKETIAGLEELVYDLLSDKDELARISSAYKQELIAQQISDDDISYISQNFVPVLRQLIQSVGENEGQAVSSGEVLEIIQPLLSVETVTVMQLIGFNIRKAIGEPLTQLVSNRISSRTPADPGTLAEIQRLSLLLQSGYIDVAKDSEAFDRLLRLMPPQE
jgi:hypothetical protein